MHSRHLVRWRAIAVAWAAEEPTRAGTPGSVLKPATVQIFKVSGTRVGTADTGCVRARGWVETIVVTRKCVVLRVAVRTAVATCTHYRDSAERCLFKHNIVGIKRRLALDVLNIAIRCDSTHSFSLHAWEAGGDMLATDLHRM